MTTPTERTAERAVGRPDERAAEERSGLHKVEGRRRPRFLRF